MLINEEIKKEVQALYNKLPAGSDEMVISTIPLLVGLMLYKNKEPKIVLLSFTEGDNKIYVGSNSKE